MSAKDKIFYVILYTFFLLFIVVTVYPLIRILAISFSERMDCILTRIFYFPHWSLKNYKELFGWDSIRQGLFISFLRVVIGTFAGVIENRADLIVDGFQIRRGEGFSVFVLAVQNLILPCEDVFGKNLAYLAVFEMW